MKKERKEKKTESELTKERSLEASDRERRCDHDAGSMSHKEMAGSHEEMAGLVAGLEDEISVLKKRIRAEVRIRHSAKLESLSELVGGVAHNFNNLLMEILGNAELAMQSIDDSSPEFVNLHNITSVVDRASNLCKQMMTFAGHGKKSVEPIDINGIVKKTVADFLADRDEKIELDQVYASELPAVLGDREQLGRLVWNLLENAMEAIATVGDKGGVIRVSTVLSHLKRSELEDVYIDHNLSEGRYICLAITDNGCGMPVEVAEKMFDPFFSTKLKGRGIGLATVLGIIRGHRGMVKVESGQGQGTTVEIFLPPAIGSELSESGEKPGVQLSTR